MALETGLSGIDYGVEPAVDGETKAVGLLLDADS